MRDRIGKGGIRLRGLLEAAFALSVGIFGALVVFAGTI